MLEKDQSPSVKSNLVKSLKNVSDGFLPLGLWNTSGRRGHTDNWIIGKIRKDELSSLVYRVHPLPESLIDYVWDYGSLSEEDEKTYIAKMVDTLFINKELETLIHRNICYVTTFCINSLIEPFVQNRKLQREKLVILKSEKQFSSKVEEFFQSDNNILLQCSSLTDSPHLLLVKGMIERYIRTNKVDMYQQQNMCAFVIHLERNVTLDIPLNFLSGWEIILYR
ncbi:RNF213 [Mytilus edulis]|uniref:RNF213 n=1 Tax=Mytilus edulis TaxID=6550 RepID=A0A8S3VD73_MYTED|nr:RNF213 [Mytilus edulis]